MFDLVIGLRVYPGVSKSPVLKGTKLQTFEQVYRSILNSTKLIDVKIVVFLDGCGDDFCELIKDITPERFALELKQLKCLSGRRSFRKQYDYLAQCNAQLVAFLEDDYLLDEGALDCVFKYAESQNFEDYYTFFNSSDYYTHELHNYKCRVSFFDGVYWRTAASTTFTFLCSPKMLSRNRLYFLTYSLGNFDHNIWACQTRVGWWCLLSSIFRTPSINNWKRFFKFICTLFLLSPIIFTRRQNLWVCIPGKGTHLETQGLSFDHAHYRN